MEIKFKTRDTEARQIEYDLPTDMQSLIAKFGEVSVFDNAVDSYVISIQSLCRRNIDKTDAEISELAAAWVPGERSATVKKNAFEVASSAIGKLSPEERASLLEKLRAAG